MPSSFMQLYIRRERRRRAQKFYAAHLDNVRAWSEQVQILDLLDPLGKRLLFDGQLGWAKTTFIHGEPFLGS